MELIERFKKRRGNRIAVKAYRERRAERLAFRVDDEPDSWITVKGNHIPLDEDKNPIGGQMKAVGGDTDSEKNKSGHEATIKSYREKRDEYDKREAELHEKFRDIKTKEKIGRATKDDVRAAKKEWDDFRAGNPYYGIDASEETKAYRAAVMARYPSYGDCETIDQVQERMYATGNFWGSEMGINLDGLPVEQAREVGKSVDDFFDKVPEMRGRCGGIRAGTLAKNLYAQAEDRKVTLNFDWYSDREKYAERYSADVESGFHPSGTTERSIIHHELAHVMDQDLYYKLKGSLSTIVLDKLVERTGEKPAKIKASVSDYAKKTYRNREDPHTEFFAEAMAEYLTSPNPRETAKMVGQIVDEVLRERGLRK